MPVSKTAPSTAAPPHDPPPGTVPARPLRRHRGPSLQKTDLTRGEIVQAALAEFMEVGIAKATMDKIARRAGVAKGTLYVYFASKDAMLQGALQETIGYSALATLHHPRQPGETMRSYITRLVLPTMDNFHASGRAELARLMLGEARSYPGLAQFYREHVFTPWHRHFEGLLQIAVDEGELHGIHPATASLLLGAPFWLSLAHDTLHHAPHSSATPSELARCQIDALFGALR